VDAGLQRPKQLTSINVEGVFDLRDTLGRGQNADELEVTEELVISYEFTLTLVDLDLNGGLVMGSG
jgi:hypothetical protein